jgi:hypothetical protein
VLRVVVLVNAVALNAYRADSFHRAATGVACVAVMVAWTGLALWAYAEPRRRRLVLLTADLALAVVLLLSSPLAKGAGFRATVPGFFILGALFAWAIHYRLVGGLVAGVLLAAVDLALRAEIRQSDYGNAFLLARAVHDGVLQVLALVQRRGRELGGDLAELGRLAGVQERELRGLIRAADTVDPDRATRAVDLVPDLARLERTESVTVSAPAYPVLVPDAVVAESIRGRIAELGGTARLVTGSFGTEWELVVPRVPAAEPVS